MLFLLGNVVFASSFTLLIKWVQARQREDVITIGAINYITAALCILPEYLGERVTEHHANAVVAGAIMGACYFIAYFFVIHAIRWIGAAASTVISVLSIVVPITCGIYIWNEQPNEQQYAGVLAALVALVLIGGRRRKPASAIDQTDRPANRSLQSNQQRQLHEEDARAPASGVQNVRAAPWFTPLILLSFFLLAGTNRLTQEAFRHTAPAEQRPVFLMTAFAVASLPSLLILIVRRRISRTELLFGISMGLANILQSHFILKSLKSFDGFIVFPVVSAGSLMLTTFVTTQVFHEQLTRRRRLGIGIAVAALVLLNWH